MEESLAPGAVVAEVARRHAVYANLLHRWRREVRWRRAAPQARLCAGDGDAGVCGDERPGTIEIELGGVRVRVDASVDEAALGRVLRVLGR